MKNLYILLSVSLLSVMVSCKKEKENLDREIVGLGGETIIESALDKWLLDNFTTPYNISVKYRWDGTEYDVSKTLTPPKLEKVQPLMEVVRSSWIDPYTAQAGQDFIKKYAPKNYVLVGSYQYNAGGTVTLGEAEGGIKVTLFNVNNFVKTDRAVSKRVLKTIHHEFTHILNQTITYQKEFPRVTPAGYTGDWNNSPSFAPAGFISQYAQASPGEDFAEMVSIMLTEGRSGYEAILKANTTASAVTSIRAKEDMVVAYFKQTWGIDFYTLQTRVQKELGQYAPANLTTYLGFGKTFTTLNINPAVANEMSADFQTAYNNSKAALLGINSTAKYELDNITLAFTSATEMQLKLNFHATAGTAAGTNYVALFTHSYTTTGNQVRFTYVSRDANANVIAASVAPLTGYFTASPFLINYFYPTDMKAEFGGLVRTTDANSFTYGALTN
ncbi:zinc-binding metallopeptidase [Pedobacter faecalis]|uniref:zinc-binding metallopeptidase n=1 Tax=Pedobacter faecalis TaxID=3041495 RepID=UPI00254E2C3C|nr:putative zinc-binding metallopeptidase [Pedobacter sp. ELA7]